MKLNYIILSVLLILAFNSCSDFGDMNENPNAPTGINDNPELLLTGICKDVVNELVEDAWGNGNVMAQYAAKIVFTSFDQFEWGTNGGTWSTIYSSAREIQNLITIAETLENDSYKAVGLVLEAWMMQLATDIWGDIPYREAMKGKTDNIYTPVYDSQSDIYSALLENLKTANTLLNSTTKSIEGDIIFDCDLSLWQKFANSLRLRLLIRLTNVSDSPVNVATEIVSILQNPDTNPIMTSNDDNALLKYTSSYPNVHPCSQESGYRIGSYDEYRMSETIETVLEAHGDPRIELLFAPTSKSADTDTPEYTGMINGMVDGDAYVYKGGASNISEINPDQFYYEPNSADGILMLASEVQFIIAEAAMRYSSVAALANAREYYEKGIRLNFEYWDVDMPDDFLSRTSVNSTYSVPVAFDNNLETVITQKWVSLFYVDYQGFIEFKRTGFPGIIEPGPDAFSDVYPSRFTYPDEEQALNYDNYEAAVKSQAGSLSDYSYWTPVWWENK